MDIKSTVVIEIKKNDNVYRFEMPVGAPFGECYDAAFQTLNKVSELAKEAADKMNPQAAETQPVEEVELVQ